MLGLSGYLGSLSRAVKDDPDIPSQVSSVAPTGFNNLVFKAKERTTNHNIQSLNSPFSQPVIAAYSHKVVTILHCPLVQGSVEMHCESSVHGTGGYSQK